MSVSIAATMNDVCGPIITPPLGAAQPYNPVKYTPTDQPKPTVSQNIRHDPEISHASKISQD